jgi:phage-related minor tail protein
MSKMWFYDDYNEMEGFNNLREAVKRLEKEYLDLRIQLRDTETELRSNPDSEYLQAKAKYLKKRLKDIEKKGPRLADDYPLEFALFSAPHG